MSFVILNEKFRIMGASPEKFAFRNPSHNAGYAKTLGKIGEYDRAMEIIEIANGYQMMTKSKYHGTVGQYLKNLSRKKLSKAALETLSIIAYKQPVTRLEIESIRGVGSDYTIQKLLEKDHELAVLVDSTPPILLQ